MDTFFVFSLPRSRTAWLACLLTTEKSHCYHELFLQTTDIVKEFTRVSCNSDLNYVGNSDSGNLLYTKTICDNFPRSRKLIVRRSVGAVYGSFLKAFPECSYHNGMLRMLEEADHTLDRLSKEPLTMTVGFSQLADIKTLKLIWNYLMPELPFNERRAELFQQLNVQTNMSWNEITNLCRRKK